MCIRDRDQAVEMVLDIEKYPEFVPWCIEGKVFDKNESSDLITFNGDLKVGKSILNETFSSHVSYHKDKNKIIVTNLDGPLKYLKNEWKFKEFESIAKNKGFLLVSSSPLTRSSYHADDDFKKLQDARNKQLECHPHH